MLQSEGVGRAPEVLTAGVVVGEARQGGHPVDGPGVGEHGRDGPAGPRVVVPEAFHRGAGGGGVLYGLVNWAWSLRPGQLGLVLWAWSCRPGLVGLVFWAWSLGPGLVDLVSWAWSRGPGLI